MNDQTPPENIAPNAPETAPATAPLDERQRDALTRRRRVTYALAGITAALAAAGAYGIATSGITDVTPQTLTTPAEIDRWCHAALARAIAGIAAVTAALICALLTLVWHYRRAQPDMVMRDFPTPSQWGDIYASDSEEVRHE